MADLLRYGHSMFIPELRPQRSWLISYQIIFSVKQLYYLSEKVLTYLRICNLKVAIRF